MGKFTGVTRYEEAEKHNFPRYRQEHELSCGPACLRMIAEWLKGVSWSEYHWRNASGWTASDGLGPNTPGLAKALELLTKEKLAALEISKSAISKISNVDPNEVYLLWTDSYGYDGRNVGHWIILLALFNSKEFPKASGRTSQPLALYADPLEDQLVVWSWNGLKASEVQRAFQIKRP